MDDAIGNLDQTGKGRRMKALSVLIGEHAMSMLVGAVFFCLGVAVSAFFHYQLKDNMVTLIGSVAGAVGAVGGAFMLWQAQESRVQRGNARAIAQIVLPTLAALNISTNGYGLVPPPEHFAQEISMAIAAVEAAQRTLKRFDAKWNALSGPELSYFLALETTLEQLNMAFRKTAMSLVDGSYGFNAMEEARQAKQLVDNLHNWLRKLNPM